MRKIWSEDAEKTLAVNYPTKSMDELLKLLPTFTKEQIRNKAKKMGLERAKSSYSIHMWTAEEDEIIIKNYKIKTTKEIAELFDNISESQISNRINRLGLTKMKPRWTQEEIDYLEKNYGKKSIENLIEEKLSRFDAKAITKKAHRLGISTYKIDLWTKEEIKFLELHYKTKPNKFIQENYLPNRSVEQIKSKAKALGLKKDEVIKYKAIVDANRSRPDIWTEEEKKILIEHYGKINNKVLKREYLPHKSIEGIKGKARQLGLQNKTRQYFDWNQKDILVNEDDFASITFVFEKIPVE